MLVTVLMTGGPRHLFLTSAHSRRTGTAPTVGPMSESGRDTSRLPDAQPARPATSVRPVLQTVLLDVAPPLIAYYGLRAAGASEYVALLSATVLSGLRVVYGVIKSPQTRPVRRLSTADVRPEPGRRVGHHRPQADPGRQHLRQRPRRPDLPGQLLVGTPLTQVVAQRFRQPEDAAPTIDEAAHLRRIHILLSAMWGIGLLVEVAIRWWSSPTCRSTPPTA